MYLIPNGGGTYMKNIIKKTLSLALTLLLVVSALPLGLITAAATEIYAQSYGRIYSIKSDAVTLNGYKDYSSSDNYIKTADDAFGGKNGTSDGRVWTDRSVQAVSGGFDVTMSALAQDYLRYTGEYGEKQTVGVDTLMMIDMTGSMTDSMTVYDYSNNSYSATKLTALAKSLNDAIDVIMEANPDNRVQVIGYALTSGLKPQYYDFLALGHYENSSWTNANPSTIQAASSSGVCSSSTYYVCNGKYFSAGNGTLQTNENLTLNGTKVTQVSKDAGNGTDVQNVLIYGIQSLIKTITSEKAKRDSVYKTESDTYCDRAPFVMVLSDGACSGADKNYCFSTTPRTSAYSSSSRSGDLSGYYNEEDTGGSLAAYTILTAAYQKDLLKEAYSNYNAVNRLNTGKNAFDVQWFNIGLGLDSTDSKGNYVKGNEEDYSACAFIKPSLVRDNIHTHSAGIKSYINSVATGAYAAYATPEKYVFTDADSYFADTSKTLSAAFEELSNRITTLSTTVIAPVTVNSSSADAAEQVIFKDVIGGNAEVTEFTLVREGVEYTGKYDAEVGQYLFETETGNSYCYVETGYESGRQTVTWTLPAAELGTYAMFTHNQEEPEYPYTYNSAEPIRLKYHIVVSHGTDETPVYSNAIDNAESLATATYYVPDDNPYYYDVLIDYDENNLPYVAGSELKTDLSKVELKKGEAIDDKIEPYVRSLKYSNYTYDKETENGTESVTVCKCVETLGNNGKADLNFKISKTCDNHTPERGETINFEITVENYGDSAIPDIKLEDLIPTGTTYISGSVKAGNTEYSAISYKNSDSSHTNPYFSIIISSLGAASSENGKLTFTYSVKVNSDADVGEIKVDYPAAKEVNGEELEGGNNDENAGNCLTIDVVSSPSYSLIYSWENAPADLESAITGFNEVIEKRSTESPTYTIDTTYQKGFEHIYDGKKYTFDGFTVTGSKTGTVYAGSDTDYTTYIDYLPDEDLYVKGSWTAVKKAFQTYKFTVNDGALSVPQELIDLQPEAVYVYVGEDFDKSVTQSTTSISCFIGKDRYDLTFDGFEYPEGKATGDVTIYGNWKAELCDKIELKYAPSIKDGATAVPTAVSNAIDFDSYYEGEEFDVTEKLDEIKNGDPIEAIVEGVRYSYSVASYSGEKGTQSAEGESVSVVWLATECDKIPLKYEPKLTGDLTELTEEIEKSLALELGSFQEGTTYDVTELLDGQEAVTVTVGEDEYSFEIASYTGEKGTQSKDGNIVSVIWNVTKIEQAIYSLKYEFVVKTNEGETIDNSTLPAEVTDYLPEETTGLKRNDIYTVSSAPADNQQVVAKTTEKVKYTFVFTGYDDPNGGKMPADDVAITGNWVATEYAKHTVSYSIGENGPKDGKITDGALPTLPDSFQWYEDDSTNDIKPIEDPGEVTALDDYTSPNGRTYEVEYIYTFTPDEVPDNITKDTVISGTWSRTLKGITKLVPVEGTDTVVERVIYNEYGDVDHVYFETYDAEGFMATGNERDEDDDMYGEGNYFWNEYVVNTAIEPFCDSYGYDEFNEECEEYFIFGLDAGCGLDVIEEYVEVVNGYMEYSNDRYEYELGTGTVINVYDLNDNFVERFYVVIYGDLDGNGIASSTDVKYMRENQDYLELPCLERAYDLDANGYTTQTDIGRMDKVIADSYYIDQRKGMAVSN